MNAKLSIAGVAAEATVVAQSETVSQTSQAATTYGAEMTNKLPVNRNYLSVGCPGSRRQLQLSPATPRTSAAPVVRQRHDAQRRQRPGPVRGTPSNLFIEDAIQETTTMTSGVSAEYGRFTGGVINAVTKQGGNSFCGSFRVSLNNDDWQAQPPIPANYNDMVVPTYEATLGGPIWKDKIWFFGAGRYVENETSVADDRTHRRPVVPDDEHGHAVRRQADHHVRSEPHPVRFVHEPAGGAGQLRLHESPPPLRRPDHLRPSASERRLSLSTTTASSPRTSSSRRSTRRRHFKFENSGGRSQDLIDGHRVLVAGPGLCTDVVSLLLRRLPRSRRERNNNDYLVKGTYFLSTKSLGSHNVAFGYENFGSPAGLQQLAVRHQLRDELDGPPSSTATPCTR